MQTKLNHTSTVPNQYKPLFHDSPLRPLFSLLTFLPGLFLIGFVILNYSDQTPPSQLMTSWKVYRDFFYKFFIAVFVIVGILKLTNPKLSQAILPPTIISLLFVTFSYAIAMLLIDLSHLFSQIF